VVVNDLGGSMTGEGTDAGPAADVVAEITDAGGTAVADTSDVASEAGATTLVATAVEAFGRLDVLVANAGIMRWARFPDVSTEDYEAHLAVHVGGSFHTARAAWPHLVEHGDGRVVLTTSTGMLGMVGNTAYGIAKGGVVGLVRSLAVAGRKRGVKANAIAPAASTRMAGEGGPEMPAEQVAPMVAYLAHGSCPVSGEIYTAGAGRFARVFLGSTPGWVSDSGDASVEDVASHWDAINDVDGAVVPADLMEWSGQFLSHLAPPQESR